MELFLLIICVFFLAIVEFSLAIRISRLDHHVQFLSDKIFEAETMVNKSKLNKMYGTMYSDTDSVQEK